ncbi:MAG: bifunctional 4-hydroxy-2-oxoglutarate aldolase/2-dehydro-3-deoxy-phosphogluconate aldolase [Rhodothermales bacterium]
MDMTETATALRASGLIAIVRGDYGVARTIEIAEALVGCGINTVEITLNTTGALEAIGRLRDTLAPDAWIGAGTVRTPRQVQAAIDAGAQFLISPNFDPESVALSQRAGILHLPGVFTPSEAQAAFAAGCNLVKLFPADLLGPAYLKALRAPLDDVGFVPTGGIDAETIGAYVQAGAVAFGIGSALVRGTDQTVADLRARAARLIEALQQARW